MENESRKKELKEKYAHLRPYQHNLKRLFDLLKENTELSNPLFYSLGIPNGNCYEYKKHQKCSSLQKQFSFFVGRLEEKEEWLEYFIKIEYEEKEVDDLMFIGGTINNFLEKFSKKIEKQKEREKKQRVTELNEIIKKKRF